MPCYSRVSSTVEFGAKTDLTLLGKALESLGYVVARDGQQLRARHPKTGAIATFANGVLSHASGFNGRGVLDEKALKRAYSAQVVQAAARRFGWSVQQVSESQFHVTRRI